MNAGAFTFDPADPTVGIFGEAWYCDCGSEEAATESPVGEVNRPHGETDFVTLLVCPECGESEVVTLRDYTGWDEPADYEADWLDSAHA